MTDEKGTLGSVAQTLFRVATGAGTRGSPGLSICIWCGRRVKLILGDAIDAGSNALNGDVVAIVVCDSVAVLLELFWSKLELVVFMAENAVCAASRVGEARAILKIAKVLVEAVVGGGDEHEAGAVFAKDGGSKLLERCFVEVLDAAGAKDGGVECQSGMSLRAMDSCLLVRSTYTSVATKAS